MVELKVKWGKESLSVTYDPSTGYDGLTQLLQEKTNVPVDRMKIMPKSKHLWKGYLKPDTVVDWDKAVKAAGSGKPLNLLLMGSAAELTGPTTKTIFLEDLPPEEIAKVVEPAGLTNLGNTCYLNSVVQCLRAIPSFRRGIAVMPGTNGTAAGGSATTTATNNPVHRALLQALERTLEQLDRQTTALSPFPLVQATKLSFPQFATTGPQGQPQQQDAEEFYSAILNVTAGETSTRQHVQAALPTSEADGESSSNNNNNTPSNMVDALFGIRMKETLTCDEVPDGQEPPVVSYDLHRKLVCNIQGGGAAAGSTTNVSHVAEGITLALQEGSIEKHSAVLNRNASWTRRQCLARLPPILTVQFGRFYWKATPESQDHAGVKCKIMKPVTFQATLDVYDFCSDDIQAVLQKSRQAAAQAEEDRVTKKLKGIVEDDDDKTNGKDGSVGEEKTKAVPMETEKTENKEGGGDGGDEDSAALQAALAMSMDTDPPAGNAAATAAASSGEAAKPADTFIGPGLPQDFQGIYELFAVVTHKGRNADGGHYMAWVKSATQPKVIPKIADTSQDNEDWFVFDDDEVSPCKTEDILKLNGGGDYHMSYLNFYRAKK